MQGNPMSEQHYPVLEIIPELKARLADHRVVILQAPPGAGKSTVLPLQLLDEVWLSGKKIVMLEPRRLATRSVAMRMAHLVDEPVGKTVGYRVRFDSKVSADTRIEVVTEGILTRMIQSDNALEEVGLIIFDEFHERSLHADLALALSLQVRNVLRDDLRILIMSATLDLLHLATRLNAPVVKSSGRQYPVAIEYVPEEDQRIHINVAKAVRRALMNQQGDVLAFLPGAGEIQRAAEALIADFPEIEVHALYGDLSYDKQQAAILPSKAGKRKVVLATSIAETSLTIEGVKVVIDSGYSRVPRFDAKSGFTRLETIRVTVDVADQRAGRAGRLGPGTCYRLWASNVQATLKASRTPEILEADLAPLMLELFTWGVKDVSQLDWVTPPPTAAVAQARQLLQDLEAVQQDQLTGKGKKMVKLPTHPRIAHLLVAGVEERDQSALALATDVAAILEERDPLDRSAGADLALRIEMLRKWRNGERVQGQIQVLDRIERLATAWRKLLKVNVDNGIVADSMVGRMIMEAFPERIGRQVEKNSERFKLMNNRMAKLPPNDALTRQPWIAVAELDAGTNEGKIFLAAALDPTDLESHVLEQTRIFWDETRDMLAAVIEKRIGILLLHSRPATSVQPEQKVDAMCAVIREKGIHFLGWEEQLLPWQARILSLRKWRPDEDWPDVSDEALTQSVGEWLAPFLNGATKKTDLEKLDAASILNSILPWELQSRLNTLAPLRIEVPSGSSIQLKYSSEGAPPVMEVRLQEMFGLLETPTVNEGRNKIMLHLLSPGYKPVQVTQDLKSFWSTTYNEVRKELRMRYPKHSWPEDPWTAEAVRGVKRK